MSSEQSPDRRRAIPTQGAAGKGRQLGGTLQRLLGVPVSVRRGATSGTAGLIPAAIAEATRRCRSESSENSFQTTDRIGLAQAPTP